MQEPYGKTINDTSYEARGVYGFGLTDVLSLPALMYLVFSVLVLSIYSSLTPESAFYASYKLALFLRSFSYFSIFLVPTIVIYFALNLNRKITYTLILTAYPIASLSVLFLVFGASTPGIFMLSAFVLFAFYFLLGLTRTASRWAHEAGYWSADVRRSADVRERQMDTRRGNRNSDFNPPESFLEKLDKFLDLYEYADGEAVRKRRGRRNVRAPTRPERRRR